LHAERASFRIDELTESSGGATKQGDCHCCPGGPAPRLAKGHL